MWDVEISIGDVVLIFFKNYHPFWLLEIKICKKLVDMWKHVLSNVRAQYAKYIINFYLVEL